MLRREILSFPRADGGMDLFDPVLDRVHLLDATESLAFGTSGELPARLSGALLEEGPMSQLVRTQWWARKRASVPPPPSMAPPVNASWELAETLPLDRIDARWREGEAWRRIAEDRAAGAQALPMRSLLCPEFAEALAEAHAQLVYERMDIGITFADRHICTPEDRGPVADWLEVMGSDAFRELMGAVLGLPLPAKVTANAWRMNPGDEIRAHPVGTTYVATISLGLNAHWTAADLGSIAFADVAPGESTFRVTARWLPHLGDALAIARGPASWHWVEAPTRLRRTLTGWWVMG